MTPDRTTLGITLMITTMLIFAVQDGISRYLAEAYNVTTVVMIRYWFFAIFVLAVSSMRAGGIRRAARTTRPILQICRGVLLVLEILVMVTAFVRLGLVESHAIFASFPLIVTALAVPVLRERVGWRRWSAVGIGFIGVLIIMRPGFRVFSPDALIPVLSATMFAGYHILTRLASRTDTPETSFFWTGIAGAAAITLIGPFYWDPMVGTDWWWMLALCITAALGHFMLIQALTLVEASVIQPFNYFQLVFAALIGVLVFQDSIDAMTIAGCALIVSAGMFAIRRAQVT